MPTETSISISNCTQWHTTCCHDTYSYARDLMEFSHIADLPLRVTTTAHTFSKREWLCHDKSWSTKMKTHFFLFCDLKFFPSCRVSSSGSSLQMKKVTMTIKENCSTIIWKIPVKSNKCFTGIFCQRIFFKIVIFAWREYFQYRKLFYLISLICKKVSEIIAQKGYNPHKKNQ